MASELEINLCCFEDTVCHCSITKPKWHIYQNKKIHISCDTAVPLWVISSANILGQGYKYVYTEFLLQQFVKARF